MSNRQDSRDKETLPNEGVGGERSGFSGQERFLQKKLRLAKGVLGFETLWPRIWLPFSVCGVFVLLSAFEAWPYLPPRIHLGLLWAFGGALALSFIPLLLWRRPSREKALARLEKASALDHRPLTAFNDTLSQSNASPEMQALWNAHQTQVAASLRNLKAGAPHPRIDKYDPFALRFALILMLIAVAAWTSTDLTGRVKAAFKVPEIPPSADFRLDAWITPPAYTRKEPIVLANGTLSSASQESIAVPAGSTLTVKINGVDALRYTVSLASDGAAEPLNATGQSSDNFVEYAQKLDQPVTLNIKRRYGSARSWALTVVPDMPPKISFVGPIEVSPRATMLFKYKVEDDYGVVAAEARIERVTPTPREGEPAVPPVPQIGKPPVFALSLPRSPIKAAEGKTYKDLTAHPWAGLPVVITLIAKDEAGNEGASAPRGLILPERKFTKSLAKAVAGQRRMLVEDPEGSALVANNLNALAITAEDDGIAASIYLNLRSASLRLQGQPPLEQIESVVDQLWDVAVRIEDGNLSGAERDLRAAQERLKEALERGASPQEIQKLVAELRDALNRYLRALAQRGPAPSDKSASGNNKTITQQELQQYLNKIESLAKAGSPEAAAQMLNQLRDILESLQTAKGGSGSGSEEEDAENLKQMDQLTGLMRQQQQLLDQTFRAQQNENKSLFEKGQRGRGAGQDDQSQGSKGQSGSEGQPSPGDLQQRQGDLQRQLQELLDGMSAGKDKDGVRQKLKDAERSMGEAGESLGANDLPQAGEQQGHALEALRQGTRAMAEQMMRSANGAAGREQAGRDPLGRRNGGQMNDPGDSVKVPDEITVQRAREILDELRKRLGQPSRPPVELDYLERLIKRF